jgi:glyoxylase-like metal-dependent hydrolase (beta-lactamase superfamily II)
VKGFYEPRSGSIQYVVTDPKTRRCAIIDPVYEFDEKSGATATHQADAILAYVAREGLTVEWILDTHPHADHFSAAHYLKQKTGAPTAIGARVTDVQKLWQGLYNWPELATDGSQWDRLFAEGDSFKVGELTGRVMFSPGHPCLRDLCDRRRGLRARHDLHAGFRHGAGGFPGRQRQALWASIQAILALPDDTRLFTGHDYEPGGRAARWESTVGEQKRATRICRHDGGALRRAAGGARPHPADAEADPACAAGQHPRRPAAGARSQRQALSQIPARCARGAAW